MITTKKGFLHAWRCMACGIGMAACMLPAAAQENSPKRISFAERWAFKTNAVDWVLTTPNIGVEFDLSDKVYNKWTLGAQVKWNGGSNQDFNATLDYKMLDGRLELRRYWRTGLKGGSDSKRIPKFWRAYYWGIYAGYTNYTVFIKNGYTGKHASVGASLGWEVPLYAFKRGGLDLDLGLSAGFIYGKYRKREMQDGQPVFVKEKDWHLTPYPVPTEIRVGLVYRFQQIKAKYNKSKNN